MSADRNLLFGILAVQLDFVSQDELMAAMNAWLLDKAKPLGEILRERGAIDVDTLALLDALVRRHLAQHGDDPQRSLAALSSVESVKRALASLDDADVQGTLQQVGAGPTGTLPYPGHTVAEPGVRYRILRPHKKGGLGEVYVAEDTELGREVALKEIQSRWADHADSRGRFVLEAEITGGLEHPGIVPVYGLGTYSDGRPFYAMRFIQGDNLQDAIRRFHDRASGVASAPRVSSDSTHGAPKHGAPKHGALTRPRSPDFTSLEFRDLLRRFIDVCNAVAYAHSRGVLHRDLKPGNIMLGQYGETLVVDWGLAKVTGQASGGCQPPGSAADALLRPRSAGESSATVAGVAMGTPAYMSPEQADGRLGDLGPATEVYALGATLYEVLCGRAPIQGSTQGERVERARTGQFDRPRAVLPEVPPALEAVCLKAMASRSAGRYASATELAREVERWLADEPVTACPEPAGERLARWARHHARLVTGVTAALAVGITSLALATVLLTEASARERAAKKDAVEARLLAEQKERNAVEARLLAERQWRTATAVASFLTELFRSADQVAVAGFGFRPGGQSIDTLTARQMLDRGRDRLTSPSTLEPAVRAAMLDTIGNVYRAAGQFDVAERLLNQALELRRQAGDDLPLELAAVLFHLGWLDQDRGRYAEAEGHYREALRLFQVQPEPDQLRATAVMINLAWLLSTPLNVPTATRITEADQLFRDAVRIRRRHLGDNHRDVGISLLALGTYLLSVGKTVQASTTLVEAFGILDRPENLDQSTACYKTYVRGQIEREARRYDQAARLYADALAQVTTLLGEEHPLRIMVLGDYAGVLGQAGDWVAAERVGRRALDLARRSPLRGHPAMIEAVLRLGDHVRGRGDAAEAEALFREAVALATVTRNEGLLTSAKDRLTGLLRELGRNPDADKRVPPEH